LATTSTGPDYFPLVIPGCAGEKESARDKTGEEYYLPDHHLVRPQFTL